MKNWLFLLFLVTVAGCCGGEDEPELEELEVVQELRPNYNMSKLEAYLAKIKAETQACVDECGRCCLEVDMDVRGETRQATIETELYFEMFLKEEGVRRVDVMIVQYYPENEEPQQVRGYEQSHCH